MTKAKRSTPKTTRPRYLTERQAWQVVSLMFEYRSGMCHAVRRLDETELLSAATQRKMSQTLRKAVANTNSVYLWPPTLVQSDDNRVNFARVQARRAPS